MLPSPTRINSSVRQSVSPSVRLSACPSVRTCLQIRCSAENGTGPTDLVNYSLKSRINVNRESESKTVQIEIGQHGKRREQFGCPDRWPPRPTS